MKSRRTQIMEYQNKYSDVPRDYISRLNWLCDKYNVSDSKADEIIRARQTVLNNTYYETIRLVFYEEPNFTPRPRARMITRKGVLNAAMGNNNFIQVYSITGQENKEYMKMVLQKDLERIGQLLCTPCDVDFKTYFPTPAKFNVIDTFLAEIGLIRFIGKPDADNIAKCYLDSFTDNLILDDILVQDLTIKKYYSVLPRVEVDLKYSNHLLSQVQYTNMIKRKDFKSHNLKVDYIKYD